MGSLDGIILMGPFGSGKSYLGRALCEAGVAHYLELEPIIYERFRTDDDIDVAQATAFIRQSYHDQIAERTKPVAFESTGVVQRPLLLDMMATYSLALVRICIPKSVCLARVEKRNATSHHPITPENAANFYDYWHNEIAPTYTFALNVDGTDVNSAIHKIEKFVA